MSRLKKATRAKARLRLAICGPAGAGKSYTALRFAVALATLRGKEQGRPGRVAAIDTESGSLSLYVGLSPDGVRFEFDVIELRTFPPSEYTSAMEEIHRAGVDVMIVDSLSHAWEGAGGALELVDKKREANPKDNAWKDVSPMHRRMVDTILASPCVDICTLRAATEVSIERNKDGSTTVRKIGLRPKQREGMEYEFTLFADIDDTHTMTVTKSRCPAVDKLAVVTPGASFIDTVYQWLILGVDAQPQAITGAVAGTGESAEDRAALVQQIRTDAVRIGWDRAALDAEVKQKYGVANLGDLGVAELSELAKRLAKLPSKRQALVPAGPLNGTTTPAATVPANVNGHERQPIPETLNLPPKKVSAAQMSHIKTLQQSLFAVVDGDQAAKNAKWKEQLGKYGVTTAKDLTEEAADRFILSVQHEIVLLDEGGEPFTKPPDDSTAPATQPTVPG